MNKLSERLRGIPTNDMTLDEQEVIADAILLAEANEQVTINWRQEKDPEYPGPWKSILGDITKWEWLHHEPHWGKYTAHGTKNRKEFLQDMICTNPKWADTLAISIFFEELASEREKMAWHQVNEERAEKNKLYDEILLLKLQLKKLDDDYYDNMDRC